jgi:hypothetical protein
MLSVVYGEYLTHFTVIVLMQKVVYTECPLCLNVIYAEWCHL